MVGKKVPNFSVDCFPAGQFQLSSQSGKRIVLYFYPKDDTPGCTLEGHADEILNYVMQLN